MSELFHFQREGAAWLAARRRALLADDMGLGKTVQALAAHRSFYEDGAPSIYNPACFPLLVVCPAIVKSVWAEHARAWLGPGWAAADVHSGRGRFRWPGRGEVAIVNYDILPAALASSGPEEGTTLVADEAHYVKGPSAFRTQKFRAMARAVLERDGRAWLLTGTPIKNEPPDLWHMLDGVGLAEKAYGSWAAFRKIFGARDQELTVRTRWGRDRKIQITRWGRVDREAARAGFDRVALRRTKPQVLDQLPPKLRRELRVEVPQDARALCDAAMASLEAEGRDPVKVLADMRTETAPIAEARLALASAKVKAALDLARLVEEGGGACVAFSAHRAPTLAVAAAMPGWAAITGSTAPAERARIVERFQSGELRGIAATIAAAGIGITLTRATDLLFIDLAWTPSENLQAEDRACRIGQRGSVTVTTLVAEHRLDAAVLAALRRKTETAGFMRPHQPR